MNGQEEKFDLIEAMNKKQKDIYMSKEYNLGRSIKKIQNYILKGNFRGIGGILLDKHAANVVKRKYSRKNSFPQFYRRNFIELPKKLVIYTCILGEYDLLEEPIIKSPNIDYIIFTDWDDLKIPDGWKKRKIPDKYIALNNNILINRYIKMHPYDFFCAKYDYAIYIDGNVKIYGNIYSFLGIANKSILGLAMYQHKERDCIYDEEIVCELYRKGVKRKMREQVLSYKKNGFPLKFGLLEATIIISDMKNLKGKKLLEDWWEEFFLWKSERDQLALPYIIWKNNYSLEDIGIIGNNILMDNRLHITIHN